MRSVALYIRKAIPRPMTTDKLQIQNVAAFCTRPLCHKKEIVFCLLAGYFYSKCILCLVSGKG